MISVAHLDHMTVADGFRLYKIILLPLVMTRTAKFNSFHFTNRNLSILELVGRIRTNAIHFLISRKLPKNHEQDEPHHIYLSQLIRCEPSSTLHTLTYLFGLGARGDLRNTYKAIRRNRLRYDSYVLVLFT